MGTDINAYIMARSKGSNDWQTLSLYRKNLDTGEMVPVSFYTGRDYDLFGLLAGVRSCISPLVENRGMPEELSPEVRDAYFVFDEDGDDVSMYWHNATWYDITELRAYVGSDKVRAYDDPEDEDWGLLSARFESFVNDINQVLDAYWIFYPNPGDVRVVMWFDS